MKILVNATPLLAPRTGIGQYIHHLFSAMQQLDLVGLQMAYGFRMEQGFTPPAAVGRISKPLLRQLAIKLLPYPRETKRLVEEFMFRLRTRQSLSGSIYHEPNYLPLMFDGPVVITVCDMSCFDHPEMHPKERVKIMAKRLPTAIARADHILAISQDSKNALQRCFGVPGDKVTVTPLAASPAFVPITQDALLAPLSAIGLSPRGYVLTVGTIEPRKNLTTLFKAFARLPKALRRRFPLVVAGMKGWHYHELIIEAQSLVSDGELRFLGYVDDTQMPTLFAGAAAFCYPSKYEGFGLPALEAMSAGVPVLTSNATSLPEVVGDAGLMTDPDDIEGMSQRLELLLEDTSLSRLLAHKGLVRAGTFSWTRCAQQTVDVYKQVARDRGLAW